MFLIPELGWLYVYLFHIYNLYVLQGRILQLDAQHFHVSEDLPQLFQVTLHYLHLWRKKEISS